MRCQYCGRIIPDDSAFVRNVDSVRKSYRFMQSQVLIQHRNQSRKFARYAAL